MSSVSALWDFADIEKCDRVRASILESAPSAEVLLKSVVAKLAQAVSTSRLCVGMEERESDPQDQRAVLQFHIGATLFDQFFNARTGYRAQFRRDWRKGCLYNRAIIDALRSVVASIPSLEISARHLTSDFEDCGSLTITVRNLYDALDPDLSKVWFGGWLMTGDGAVRQLPSGVVGPRLCLADHSTWAAMARTDSDAWLEVKGPFLGRNGPYQLKDPTARAKNLHRFGTA